MKLIRLALPITILALWKTSLLAEEIQWRPARSPRPAIAERKVQDCAGRSFHLGAPIPIRQDVIPAINVRQTSVSMGAKVGRRTIIRAQGPGVGVAPVPPPPAPPLASTGAFGQEEGYKCANTTIAPADPIVPGAPGPGGGYFINGIYGIYNQITNPIGGRHPFQSDHAFDGFVSPMTNPFYFEDPRALTEVRAIYIFQDTPGNAPAFAGGEINTFALQARVALTERLSFVLSRLGWIWTSPNEPMGDVQSAGGFSELHFGPKYTFIRNDSTKTLLAGGLTFEIPTGDADVFQNTGDLSLRPYLSFGQELWQTPYGRFHFLNSTGYNFGVDSDRTDFFFSSFHLDFDIGNWGRIYPFLELNWFVYTSDGQVRNQNFEGRDLINFGANDVSGHNDLSIAVGSRFKWTEILQFGAGIEFPLLKREDLMDFRLTFDLILRY